MPITSKVIEYDPSEACKGKRVADLFSELAQELRLTPMDILDVLRGRLLNDQNISDIRRSYKIMMIGKKAKIGIGQ